MEQLSPIRPAVIGSENQAAWITVAKYCFNRNCCAVATSEAIFTSNISFDCNHIVFCAVLHGANRHRRLLGAGTTL